MNQEPPNSASTTCEVALALQGGGSHGAFTWGVLDGLLEEPTLEIRWLTGTSAGAMNAVFLVDGFGTGRRQGSSTCVELGLGIGRQDA